METNRLLRALARYYPKRLAEGYDHVGLQLGTLKEETKRIFLCLDFDSQVFEEARAFGPDLIITHHPYFFGNPKKIMEVDVEKAELTKRCEEAGLAIYSYHTNFDAGYPGMNDELALRLGLLDVANLATQPTARGGRLPEPMDIHEFAEYAKKALRAPYGLLIAAGKPVVEKVAIIGGAGSFAWRDVKEEGYDVYISGDAPHHARREILLAGFDYLDLPHEIEGAFVERMKKTLLSIDGSLEIGGEVHEVPPEVI